MEWVEKEQSDIRKSDISFGRIGHWVIEEAHHGLRGLRAFLRLGKARPRPWQKNAKARSTWLTTVAVTGRC